jgi:Holliday junction DNA helicase RuvA
MIGYLSGSLLSHQWKDHSVESLVEVQGVGYSVVIPIPSFQKIKKKADNGKSFECFIYTHVREDALQLYGFYEPFEKEVFLTLIGVSGIGAKVALSILSATSGRELFGMIQREDLASLKKLPGIGKKTAERILMELREKIDQFDGASSEVNELGESFARIETGSGDRGASSRYSAIRNEARAALKELGYRDSEIENTVKKVLQEELKEQGSEEKLKTEDVLKGSLRALSKFGKTSRELRN